ncbi:MAG: tandem-95 repeat protein [Hyphomonadaceae bacterium]|nr:tandem-95 repeat protein [Hyphomonadaceae bacterium]
MLGVAAPTPAFSQGTTQYQYDSAGRLIGAVYPDGRQIKYRYDGAGNRLEIVDWAQNGPPNAVADAITTLSGSPISFDPRGNDADPDSNPLTIVSIANAANGVATIAGGTSVTFAPNVNFVGAGSYQYVIQDPQGLSSTATVAVTVQNRLPAAVADTASTLSNAAVPIDPRGNDSDPEGTALAVTAVSGAVNGVASITGGGTGVSFNPAANFVGTGSFAYTVTDAHGGTAASTVTVSVANRPPVAVANAYATGSGVAITVDPRAGDSDPESGALTITAVSTPTQGVATKNTAGTSVTYTPPAAYVGQATFSYTITDPLGATATSTVTVDVNNAVPVANADSLSTLSSSAITFDPRGNDTDPEGGALTISSVSGAVNGAAVVNGGASVTFTPTTGFVGSGSYTYTISDPLNATASAVVTVAIQNRVPVANADSVSTLSDAAVTFDPRGNDSDPESGALTVTGVSGATNGSAVVNGGTSITFTPLSSFVGTGTLAYAIRDPLNSIASTTATISVQNRTPAANADAYSTSFNTAVTSNPRTNDTDPEGQALTIAGVSGATNGTAVVNGGASVTFTPMAGFSGAASYQYTIQDTYGAQSSATATVNVAAALSGSLSSTSWLWRRIGNGAATVNPATVTVTGAGGAGGYSCVWEKVSGNTTTTATAPGACTTGWSYGTVPYGEFVSTWRAKVTDSSGTFVYTGNVTVTFLRESTQ